MYLIANEIYSTKKKLIEELLKKRVLKLYHYLHYYHIYDPLSDHGWTPSATLSARPPQERWARQYHYTCTSCNTPVLYTPTRPEACAGQRMSVPGRQFPLYEQFPIRNFRNRDPTRAPTAPRLMTNLSKNIEEAQEAAPILCEDIPRSSFNQTHRRSHPVSSQEEPIGLTYRLEPTMPTRHKRSPRPPPPTPPHRRPAGAAK